MYSPILWQSQTHMALIFSNSFPAPCVITRAILWGENTPCSLSWNTHKNWGHLSSYWLMRQWYWNSFQCSSEILTRNESKSRHACVFLCYLGESNAKEENSQVLVCHCLYESLDIVICKQFWMLSLSWQYFSVNGATHGQAGVEKVLRVETMCQKKTKKKTWKYPAKNALRQK